MNADEMKISFLADHPQESEQIARWYYDEWAHAKSNVSLYAKYDFSVLYQEKHSTIITWHSSK